MDAFMTVDQVISKTGEFGRAQKKIFLIMGMLSALSGIVTLGNVFAEFSTPWQCIDNENHYRPVKNNVCESYSKGMCFAKFDKFHETIVSEVGLSDMRYFMIIVIFKFIDHECYTTEITDWLGIIVSMYGYSHDHNCL